MTMKLNWMRGCGTALVTPFHKVLLPLLMLTFIGSLVNLYKSMDHADVHYSAALIAVMALCAMVVALFARIFSLKAQDRAIRAEENLRHFALSGKLFDKRLTLDQVIGLRFASDGELVELSRKAAAESMSRDAIKKSIKSWRADPDRL